MRMKHLDDRQLWDIANNPKLPCEDRNQAFGLLYEKNYKKVRERLRAKFGNDEKHANTIDDILHESIIEIHKGVMKDKNNWQPLKHYKFEALWYVVANNTSISIVRKREVRAKYEKKTIHKTDQEVQTNIGNSKEFVKGIEIERLKSLFSVIVDKLFSPRGKDCMEHILEEDEYQEVADKLGLNIKQVYAAVGNSRSKIPKWYRDEFYEFFFLILFLLPICLYSQNKPTTNIEINVINAITEQDINEAQIFLTKDTSYIPLVATVKSRGLYEFSNIDTGTYILVCIPKDKQYYKEYKDEVFIGLNNKEPNIHLEIKLSLRVNPPKGDATPFDQNSVNPYILLGSHTLEMNKEYRNGAVLTDPNRIAITKVSVQPMRDEYAVLIIRNNSPTGVLTRLEGLTIMNPVHLSCNDGTGGQMSLIDATMLDKSALCVGGLPSEYGNVTSGVMDLRFKRPSLYITSGSFNITTFGPVLTLSAPIFKNKAAIIINGRYGGQNIWGIKPFEGMDKKVKDIFAHYYHNLSKQTHLSIFLLMGKSSRYYLPNTSDLPENFTSSDTHSWQDSSHNKIFGVSMEHKFGGKNILKVAIGYNNNRIFSREGSIINKKSDSLLTNKKGIYWFRKQDYNTDKFMHSSSYNHVFKENKFMLKVGEEFNYFRFNGYDSVYNWKNKQYNSQRGTNSTNNHAYQMLFYGQAHFQHPKENITWVVGGNIFYNSLYLKNKITWDWRTAFNYKMTERHSVAFSFGKYSQSLPNWSVLYKDKEGNFPNQFLQQQQSLQLTGAYSNSSSVFPFSRLRVEGYYQYFYKVPISKIAGSNYSTINSLYEYVDEPLMTPEIKKEGARGGWAENYGIELSFESIPLKDWVVKYPFLENSYMLVNIAFSRSNYMTNTEKLIYYRGRFDNFANTSILLAKDFQMKKANKLEINTRIMLTKGMRYTPADSLASVSANQFVPDYNYTSAMRFPTYWRIDAHIGWRTHFRKVPMLISVDFQDLLSLYGFYKGNRLSPYINQSWDRYSQKVVPTQDAYHHSLTSGMALVSLIVYLDNSSNGKK